jgi:hypothetical protein
MKSPKSIGQCLFSSLQGDLFPCLIVSTEEFGQLPFNILPLALDGSVAVQGLLSPPAVDGSVAVQGLLRSDNGNDPLGSRWPLPASDSIVGILRTATPSGRRFAVFLQRHTSRTTVQTTAVPESISVCKMQTVNRQQLALSAICLRGYGRLP